MNEGERLNEARLSGVGLDVIDFASEIDWGVEAPRHPSVLPKRT